MVGIYPVRFPLHSTRDPPGTRPLSATRQTTLDAFGYHFTPIYDWFTEPQVCGRGATKTGHGVKTAVVKAGSQIGFQLISYTTTVVGNEVEIHKGLEVPRPVSIYSTDPPRRSCTKSRLLMRDRRT